MRDGSRDDPVVNFVYVRHRHIARHSGYSALVGRVPNCRVIRGVIPQFVTAGGRFHLPTWRLLRTIELDVLVQMLRSHGQVFHHLDPDHTYRLSGLFKRVGDHHTVVTVHQPDSYYQRHLIGNDLPDRLWRQIYATADAVVVLASVQVATYERFVGKGKVHFIPHGVDSEFFSPHPNLTREGAHAVTVGIWLRDFMLLRKVAERCAGLSCPIRFTVVVPSRFLTAEHYALFADLPSVQIASGLSDDELLDLYRRAGMIFLPLRDATANNALLEGMACGAPVVATDVGGVRDYIGDDAALLVPPGDVEGCTEALIRLAEQPGLRRELGANGRARAVSLDWQRIAEQVMALYRQISVNERNAW